MPELMADHVDEFTLLRHLAGDLTASEGEAVERHVAECSGCASRMAEVSLLDQELRRASEEGALSLGDEPQLSASDPFRRRPVGRARPLPRTGDRRAFAARALQAAEEAGAIRDRIRTDVSAGLDLSALLAELSLDEPAARYGLLYALQDTGREIAAGPVGALRFAEAALQRLRQEKPLASSNEIEAEAFVPVLLLNGQAHLLAGQASNWTAQFDQAKTHLELAYRCFGAAGGDDVGLAIVEHVEAQRRFLMNEGQDALVLARRAKGTFRSLGLDDHEARADLAIAAALVELDREAEALPLIRSALDVFGRLEIWTNYVGALNNLASCLQKLGRLDEARREYARALRRFSRERDLSFLGGIRHGLAQVLFSAGKFREAAASFSQASRLYEEHGRTPKSLTAALFEIESWARSGEISRALHRLDIFQKRLTNLGVLDSHATRQIQSALSGENPDLGLLSRLRLEAQQLVESRLSTA